MDRTHSFGYLVRRRRKALDLTQAELARRVGCAEVTIQKIEADERRPSRQVAELRAECLHIDAAERAKFIQAARAEGTIDQLPLSAQPVELPTPALPHGTVTFLFTDIEGSSRLWAQHAQAMTAALAQHDALLKQIVAVHGGAVFKTVGDGVLAVFAHAHDALAAAVAAQKAISTESWPLPAPPQVRMALHTGSAETRDGDYFGPALNHAARLLAAGHGGQVLLTLATAQMLREQLPPDVSLSDLGTHQLKDISLPEQIFQITTPGLSANFPPLKTLGLRRTNLPTQLTALIGRGQEVEKISGLLRRAEVRLATLSGPGGIGKTRLGLQIAAELLDDFADGVFFIDLAPISDSDSIIGAIALTLGLRDTGAQPVLEQLLAYLHDKHTLLLLDNFEQAIAAAPLIAELLASAPRLQVLATSREILRLRGERELAVQPLMLPDPAQLPPIDRLSEYAAVALFIQRAQEARPDFRLTDANAPAVVEICARLDGLPLAIELAAARLKLFAPEALLARLSGRLALLSGGARDLPARQQTLRNAIGWSYDLLSDAEQALFRRLGVFVGGCTLEAAEAVTTLDVQTFERSDLLDDLVALIDKSLLQQREDPTGVTRFTMLETIREYALEQLQRSAELEQLRRQHARYYLALSSDQPYESDDAWTRRVEQDFDNLRSALGWNQTAVGDSEAALQLALALTTLWEEQGSRHEAIATLQRVLNHPLGIGRTRAHAYARQQLASLLGLSGKYRAAKVQFEQAVELGRELGDRWLYPWALSRLGWLAREQGDSATAWEQLSEGIAIYRQQGDEHGIAWGLNTMAEVAILDEDPQRAEALLAESRTVWQNDGSNWYCLWSAWTFNHLGHAAQLRGDYERADDLHQQALALFRSLGEQNFGLPWAYQSLGETALGRGRLDNAKRWFNQGLAISRQLGDQASITWCLAGLGSAAALDEEPGRAVLLWSAAERLRQEIGCRTAPAARVTYERALALVRAQLGAGAFEAAWSAGRAQTLEQAIAEALEAKA